MKSIWEGKKNREDITERLNLEEADLVRVLKFLFEIMG